MISKIQKEIEATKNKLAALEKKAAAEELQKIANLHKEAGFATRADLIVALQALGTVSAPRGRKASKAKKAPKGSKGKKAAAPKARKVAVQKAKKAVKKAAPKAKKAAPKAKKPAKGSTGRAKRTLITAELRQGIIDALKAGGKGNTVAAKFGVSVPTLHNIKKAAGLTKARKK
jgi:uncharacterized protein (DUF4415 family)